jgi:hypothetical protein
MPVTEITDRWVEAAAEEIYHEASRGKSWHAAPEPVKEHIRGVTRKALERGRVAEIAHRSRPIAP